MKTWISRSTIDNSKDSIRRGGLPADVVIRRAFPEEWEAAMAFAWTVFSEFEAPIYSRRGAESFMEFISDARLKSMFLHGKYPLFLAVEKKPAVENAEQGFEMRTGGEKIVGIITLRQYNFISLLFVDGRYQHRGIGEALINRACEYVRTDTEEARIDRNKEEEYRYERESGGFVTVFAALNAVGFYEKLGFYRTGPEGENDGISYIPMRRDRK
ncbi:MAG: putative acetyltransferase [Firmicutes bacterium ADurb.Bin354]|nr:MAG: putative acetyltransferase [Firmicutes bacterium ADurb.Bin354]